MGINDQAWHVGFKWTIGDEDNPTGAICLDDSSDALHICEIKDARTDWNVSTKSHPTLYIHSASDPATDYISMYHDGTSGLITLDGTTILTLTASSLDITGDLGITGDVTVVGGVTWTGAVDVVLTGPTTANDAFYGRIIASGAWASGNMVGVRGKVEISGANDYVSATGVWAGLTMTTATGTGTGLVCAINAEVYSNNTARPNAILYLQSLPDTNADFREVPFIAFTETGAGTGSNILFSLGHTPAGAGSYVTTGSSGNILYQQTIHITANGSDAYIPYSTVEGTYTTAYLIQSSLATASTTTGTGAVIIAGGLGVAGRGNFGGKVIVTATAPTGAINAIAGLATPGATWASGEVNAVYGKTTITLASDGSTYSAAGGHFELEFSGNATSGLGLTAACMCKFTSDVEAPNAILYLESYPTGTCDMSETPFITFCDYKSGSGVKSNTLLRIGDPVMAQTISTGSGKLSYNGTLRCSIYDDTSSRSIYLVTSSAQGTFTSAYPVVLTYTAAEALNITQATIANNGRMAKFMGTVATPAMSDGGGMVEVDLTLTGTATGYCNASSTWVNITTGTAHDQGSEIGVTPHNDGIYEASGAVITGASLFYGGRFHAILGDSDFNQLCLFSINLNQVQTSVFHCNSQSNFGLTTGAHASAVTGSIPFISHIDGSSIKYIRVYDSAS